MSFIFYLSSRITVPVFLFVPCTRITLEVHNQTREWILSKIATLTMASIHTQWSFAFLYVDDKGNYLEILRCRLVRSSVHRFFVHSRSQVRVSERFTSTSGCFRSAGDSLNAYRGTNSYQISFPNKKTAKFVQLSIRWVELEIHFKDVAGKAISEKWEWNVWR